MNEIKTNRINHHVKWLALIFLMVTHVLSLNANNTCEITINNVQHELIAPEGENFQWFYNGKQVHGANLKNLDPDESGTYSVVYTDENNQLVEKSIAVKVEEDGIIRIFIIGDSTVANYGSSQYPFTGWGQVLHHFFDADKISTHNRARGGRSSRSYIEEGLWNNVVAELDSGDYVFVQFGHNDRDASNASRYTSPEDYKIYLKQYVDDSRAKKAIPVLVSPMIMNGTSNVFQAYRDAMEEVALANDVPFIDLNLKSLAFYQEVGVEYAKYFIHMGLEAGEYDNYPDGYSDYWTHYQEMGALAMARMITEEIEDKKDTLELTPLADALTPLYHVSVSMNKPDAGVATISGDFPEGATVTLKARLTEDNDFLKYWVDSTNNSTLEGNLVTFTMEPRDYEFTGFVTDCYGTVDGTAAIDECGVCTGGETGLNPCTQQIPCIEFCETNANVQLIPDNEDLYNLVINTEDVANAYISNQFNVLATGTYLFALAYTNPTEGESLSIYVDDVLQISDLQLATFEDWDIVEITLDLEEGEHNIRIQTNSDTGGAKFDNLALYSDNITVDTCSAGVTGQETSFSQSDNLIVIEAENYTELKPGTNGTNWRKVQMDGTSSGRIVIAPVGTSYGAASTAQSNAPALKYDVNFPSTGNYSIWARVYAFSGSTDSYHLGLDDKVLIEKIDLYDSDSRDVYEEFTWMHVSGKKLNVSKTGVQSLEVFCREPNLIIDKIILSPDAGYSPSGLGPDETLDQATGVFNMTTSDLKFNVYPNPANSEVNVSYTNPEAGVVNLAVYNTNGQKILELANGYQQAGSQCVMWNLSDGADLNSGVYIIRLQTANVTQLKKILINR